MFKKNIIFLFFVLGINTIALSSSKIRFEDGMCYEVTGNLRKKNFSNKDGSQDMGELLFLDDEDPSQSFYFYSIKPEEEGFFEEEEAFFEEIVFSKSSYYGLECNVFLKKYNKKIEAMLIKSSLGKKSNIPGCYQSTTSDLGEFLDVFVAQKVILEDMKKHILQVIQDSAYLEHSVKKDEPDEKEEVDFWG